MWTGAPGPRGSGESASGTTTGGSTKDARRSGISSRRQTRTCAGTGRCSPATFPDAVTADGERAFAPFTTRHGCRREGGPCWPSSDVLPLRLADGPAAPCLVSYCGLLAEGETPFCLSHGARWRRAGKPDPREFTAARDDHLPGCERLDFRRLSGQLRLEAQYAVQRRRDEARLRTPPRHVSQFIGALARSGVSSVLDRTEQEWRTFPPLGGSSASQARALAIQARREAENLCHGTGWDVEYPRSTWRLRNLGITAPHAHVYFGGIPQDWLRELAKRHARWQLAAGLSSGEVTAGARAVTRLGAFLESAGITSPAAVSREALEGFLASLEHSRRVPAAFFGDEVAAALQRGDACAVPCYLM